jgi:lipopolysaccharide transport system ATP-binding protein
MSEFAIRVAGIGKQYRIGRLQPRYDTLRDSIVRSLRGAVHRVSAGFRSAPSTRSADTIWALRDVSFDVRHGEVLGIVGRNGAGKSTLLKILCRITEPTTGFAQVYGRVGSLLEVGTGFHPELTGRENVFLNGSILGMSRLEIRRRFDQIVDFAEVGAFIDTPVKHYSSGMYMRLAFAVAAHLEPEVLVVDEVLAVGDAEFQKKCLGRMNEVSREGRTVLFVSHNMHAVQRLCTRCVMLDKGMVTNLGPTNEVVSQYLATGASASVPGDWIDLAGAGRTGSGTAKYTAIQYSSLNESTGFQPYQEGPLVLTLAIQSDSLRPSVSIATAIYDQHGTKLINADSDALGCQVALPVGTSVWQLSIEHLYLKPGVYVLGLYLADGFGDIYDRIEAAMQIEVVELKEQKIGTRVDSRYDGLVSCRFGLYQVRSASYGSNSPPQTFALRA